MYTLTELPNGRYNIMVTLQGFKTATRTDIALNVADDRKIDFELAPGAVTEDVRVQADATPVKTVGGDVSGVINGQHVRELPLNGRNFLQLATLMPGVSAPDFLNVKDKGLLGGSDLSISGGGVTANLWTVDGIEQQRRRIEPHDPRLSVGRRDRGVQDPAQQLRRRVRPVRRRADQHRHPRRHQQVQRQRLLLRPQRHA